MYIYIMYVYSSEEIKLQIWREVLDSVACCVCFWCPI